MDLIGSVEFGNWLVDELKKEKILSKADDIFVRQASNRRVEALESAKALLHEFLLLQHHMMRKRL